MAANIITLLDALATELSTHLNKTVDRKYIPYETKQSITEERISCFPITTEYAITSRSLDSEQFDVGIQVAHVVPVSGKTSTLQPSGDFNNLEFLDEKLATLESIKDLFLQGGKLRDDPVGDCYVTGISHQPLFDPALLRTGIFSSITVLSFSYCEPE